MSPPATAPRRRRSASDRSVRCIVELMEPPRVLLHEEQVHEADDAALAGLLEGRQDLAVEVGLLEADDEDLDGSGDDLVSHGG